MRLRLNLGILICILLMAQTAFAYADLAQDGATVETTSMPSLSPSDGTGRIVVLQELIELDISNAEYIAIHETIVFRVSGNYTTDLMAWVPDGATDVLVSRQSMSESVQPTQIQHTEEGNIVRFNDAEYLNSNSMSMYAVQYFVPNDAQNAVQEYTKTLQYPTYINYPISNLILKITSLEGAEVIIKDEGGNIIQGDGIETGANEIVHSWNSPQFKTFTVGTKPPSDIAGILPYIVIGFLILSVLAFPFVQRKMKGENGDEKAFVESDDDSEDEFVDDGDYEEDADEEENELEVEEDEDEDEDLEKPDLDELETRYDVVLSLLNEIKIDRDNGEISDDEYETVSKKYKSEAIDLMQSIDELQHKLGL